ncbi:MAG: sigma-70 family RNA polymerase sigma factor, partial [Bacteroidota bacterium]
EVKYDLRKFIFKHYAFLRSNLEENTQEVMQEAYVRLYEAIHREGFKLKNDLVSFFWGICKNHLRELAREYQKSPVPTEHPPENSKEAGDASESSALTISLELYHTLVEQLKGNCKEVLKYKYDKILEDGKSRTSEEVANYFGLSVGYARVKIAECRQKLYKLLDQQFQKII